MKAKRQYKQTNYRETTGQADGQIIMQDCNIVQSDNKDFFVRHFL